MISLGIANKKNFISILSRRNISEYTKKVYLYLSKYFDIEIIRDEDSYSDEYSIKKNFFDLATHGLVGKTKKITSSWDKSFLNIYEKKLNNAYEYFYFIEDDVYCKNINLFKKIINLLAKSNADFVTSYVEDRWESWDWMWPSLSYEMDFFKEKNLGKSINPFCRLSSKMINKILEFNNNNKKFIFHEILFYSICLENNLKYEDLIKSPKYKTLFGTWMPGIRGCKWKLENDIFYLTKPNEDEYYALVPKNEKIYHPVKNKAIIKKSIFL